MLKIKDVSRAELGAFVLEYLDLPDLIGAPVCAAEDLDPTECDAPNAPGEPFPIWRDDFDVVAASLARFRFSLSHLVYHEDMMREREEYEPRPVNENDDVERAFYTDPLPW